MFEILSCYYFYLLSFATIGFVDVDYDNAKRPFRPPNGTMVAFTVVGF